MRMSRWLMTGVSVLSLGALAGCTESSKMTLAEMEALERRVDKQMRLVREQNEQINSNLKVIKAEMDTLKTVYIPAVAASLDSVDARREDSERRIVAEVENRIRNIADSNRQFRTDVNDGVAAQHKALTDEVTSKITEYDSRITHTEEFVNFVLARQDSVNREFANRIDKRPWYTSILGMWDDRQRARGNNP
jgi:hypothetical protein